MVIRDQRSVVGRRLRAASRLELALTCANRIDVAATTSTRQSSQLKVRERDTVAGLVGGGIRCDLPKSKFMEGRINASPAVE